MAATKKNTKKTVSKKDAKPVAGKTTIKARATEAIEGAVCYLQQELKQDGIDLTDKDAFAAVRLAASTTKKLFARPNA